MYKINDTKMFYDMADGQAVVINFETGMYYGMSSLGSAVTDCLVKGLSVAKIAEALNRISGCPEDIEGSMNVFVRKLIDKEILICTDDEFSDELPVEFGREAFDDGFIFDVNEYAEAQDLIMADPIHDVDVDMGWPIMKE